MSRCRLTAVMWNLYWSSIRTISRTVSRRSPTPKNKFNKLIPFPLYKKEFHIFLQRLIVDQDIGLNYDYMGAAEFEFGATADAREALARFHLKGELVCQKVRFFARWGRYDVWSGRRILFWTQEVHGRPLHCASGRNKCPL